MKKLEGLRLRDTLVNLTPRFPEYTSLKKMQATLAERRNIHLSRPIIAFHLKKAVQNEYISFLGGRRYTRAITPQEKFDARHYVKPGPKFKIHKPTPGLLSQLKAANNTLVQELKGASK
jgi:hypothetical protein